MPARKIRVRMQHKHHICIHNDLASAAYFYRQKVEGNKDVKGGVDGYYFDMMSCATMTAFALEAKVNYLGDQLLGRKWRERGAGRSSRSHPTTQSRTRGQRWRSVTWLLGQLLIHKVPSAETLKIF